ncbi:hypothetical protein ACHAAC_16455 [Aeromicrobium sp. CF4.19]|uniref:hypothetical protein n=1 Tax=Aeromicrobium sp. CF4.19 TaxID=3373082 RepID=UPI003EE5958D
MSVLALLLAAVGVADLVPRWRHACAALVIVAGALGLGAGWHTLWITLVCGLVVVVWLDAARHRADAGIVLLAVAALALVIASPALDFREVPLQPWYDGLPVPALDGVLIEHAALGLGALLFLTTSANVVVRRALTAVGPLVIAEEQSLKGGRLLGPMERWLVFGFALGGHIGALGALVAAKGILRFPEISRDAPDGMRAEYVLVGSFVSWTLALVLVPLF